MANLASHRAPHVGTRPAMPVQTIVIAEDDAAVRDLLAHHLEREGFNVVGAADGQSALRRARGLADLLVLDIGLPGIDGYDVARTLQREQRGMPIVMLTARTDEVDRVVGFELGADDYICKPFSPREVVARIKAILRRNGTPFADGRPALAFGRLEIDQRAREARVDGIDVKLKPREFALLTELASNPGVAMSRERLLQKVWGFDFNGDERTVDVHVRRLRAKIEEAWHLPSFLTTVHGFGYKFRRPS
jgi:DNA-binding response OmpR family regulator